MRRRQLLAGVSALAITAAAGPALAAIPQPPLDDRFDRIWRGWYYLDRLGFADPEKKRLFGLVPYASDTLAMVISFTKKYGAVDPPKRASMILGIKEQLTEMTGGSDPGKHLHELRRMQFGEWTGYELLHSPDYFDLRRVAVALGAKV